MTSGTSPPQYGHHRRIIANSEKSLNFTFTLYIISVSNSYLWPTLQASELDKQAKAHLEETYRLALEEKDEMIGVLQTQVSLCMLY